MSIKVHEFGISVERLSGYEFRVSFDKPQYASLTLDEPAPLGDDSAPNAARVLAAAIGNCLSASLVFCLSRSKVELESLRTDVRVEIVRNEQRRLRVGKVEVVLHPSRVENQAAFQACLENFEDFCVVTQSVRDGLDVEVRVEHG